MDQWHIQPSEFDILPYYRIEYMEEDLKELLDEKRKANEGSSGESYMESMQSQQNQMMRNMPKIPRVPSSFNMPRIPGF